MLAVEKVKSGVAFAIIDKIFMDKNSEGISYQMKFNEDYSHEEAIGKLDSWLKAFGLNDAQIKQVREIANGDTVTTEMSENKNIIENELKVKGIPTMIYDGKKHTGLWKSE